MSNLHELFEIFNGQDVISPIDQTLRIFRHDRKTVFVDIEDQLTPLKGWLIDLEKDTHPIRISNGHKSLSLIVLGNGFPFLPDWIKTILVIKSELMAITTVDNLANMKKLYSFWDDMELSMRHIIK